MGHIKKKHGEREELRGQKNMTPEDIVAIPYLINNFDTMELDTAFDDNKGNRAITIRKRINGVSVIATIEKGENKEFLVTSYQFAKSDALDASTETPGLNVRNDSDIANVKQDIENIKSAAINSSKIVDENGEPMVVYHYTPNEFNEFDRDKIGSSTDVGAFGRGFYLSPSDKFSLYGRNQMQLFVNARNPLMLNSENAFETKEPYYKSDYRWDSESSQQFADAVQTQGYDAVYYENRGMDKFVVFNPNQIKSTTDNNGEFGESNDVRFRTLEERRALRESENTTREDQIFIYNGLQNDTNNTSRRGQILQSVPQRKYGENTSEIGVLEQTAAGLRKRIEGAQRDSKDGISGKRRDVEDLITREYARENNLCVAKEIVH